VNMEEILVSVQLCQIAKKQTEQQVRSSDSSLEEAISSASMSLIICKDMIKRKMLVLNTFLKTLCCVA
jgi:hypothetical protein